MLNQSGYPIKLIIWKSILVIYEDIGQAIVTEQKEKLTAVIPSPMLVPQIHLVVWITTELRE